LLAQRIEMAADCASAMGEGATQREIHAGAHVIGAPVRLAVGRDRRAGAGMRAVRIGAARPDVPFVDVGVHVDEARQDDPAAQVDRRQIGGDRNGADGAQHCYPHAVYDDVAGGKPVGCGAIGDGGREIDRHARVGDAIGR